VESLPSHAASRLGSTQVGTLTLELVGLRNLLGVVNVGLFGSAQGFPSDPAQAVRSGCFPVSDRSLLIPFANLDFGRYAITVHHDENQDGILNVNSLGIPKEGIGFSGNPKIWLGAPPFEKTAFEFEADHRSITVTLKYLLP
jgi:uncharacterized protein (DUF2141 family)